MEAGETKNWACTRCGHVGLEESDGFFYCQECGAQADDIILTGVADEDLNYKDAGGDGGAALYSGRLIRQTKSNRAVPADRSSQAWFRYTQEKDNVDASNIKVKKEKQDGYLDGIGPTEPEDFGSGSAENLSYEDYYNEVRIRYVLGIQWMIELQCEALVEKFNANPLICGIAGTVWLRYLATTGIFNDDWADEVLVDSETQIPGEEEYNKLPDYSKDEPRNAYGKRAVMVWFWYLRKKIPLHDSLAVSFLACHVAREAILPTDIVKWSIEGKLPYFNAYIEIDKRFERSSRACAISPSLMFRPRETLPAQKLETVAATIADSIGLHLPPVNFYEIASRYLKKLSLAVENILPHAFRIYEWTMPPDLWLSTNEFRLPTRICVMSILIVAIRILYNINGFGTWESTLSYSNCSPSVSHHKDRLASTISSEMHDDAEKLSASPLHRADDSGEKFIRNPKHVQKCGLDSAKLLLHLEATYYEIDNTYDFTKDLSSYLHYCKDVIFPGAKPSHLEEEKLIVKLWDFYQNEKDSEVAEEPETRFSSVFNQKRSRNNDEFAKTRSEKKKTREAWHDSPSAHMSTDNADSSPADMSNDNNDLFSNDSQEYQNLAIRRLKLNMEENRFCYIPPRVVCKRLDYLQYVRKKDDGGFTYAAHADYYILLRACARVAQVDVRIMHIGVLSFERRLDWLEKRIDQCLHLTPPYITCEFCRDMADHSKDDLTELSKLNL